MNPEEIRLPPRPSREAANPRPPRRPSDDDDQRSSGQQTSEDAPVFPLSPPPIPWPRVFPSL